MSEVMIILKEQIRNYPTIFRLARYEDKATYQNHYLGLLWQVLNPIIQVGIYYMVFGLGVNGGKNIDGVPFIIWMLIGIVAWFFISSTLLGGSNSIYKQVNLVAKMKFPVSILPMNNLVSNLTSYISMLFFLVLFMFIYKIFPTIYWLQFVYYFIAMVVFLFSFGILNATITTLVRDYHIALQSILRLLFYVSGAIWNIDNRNLPEILVRILKLNPIYYLIEGFRDSFLSKEWFWNKGNYGLVFWGTTLIILILGSHLHIKFRNRFVDFV